MSKIKYLFRVCFVAVFVCSMSVSVKAEETEIDTSVFEYEENEDGTISITAYTGTDETVVIPSEIDGKSVVDLTESIFEYDQRINSISLPEGIKIIHDKSFTRCYQLETINIPSTVQIIGKEAFSGCINLKNINLPNNLLSIGDDAFSNCQNIKNVNFSDQLISMGENCFAQCISLQKVIIPGSIKNINKYNFYHCDNLQEVIITNGVQRIENRAFMGCNNLKKIVIPDSVNYIDETSFFALYETYYDKFPSNLTIFANPNSYTRTYANKMGIKFSCLNIHDWDNGSVTVEPTIKKEGQLTYTCTACGIKKIETLPKAATPKKGKTISAFNSQDVYKVTKSGTKNGTVEFVRTNNITITDISIPDTVIISGINYKVTSVAKNAFKNNKSLKKITIGKNVTKINVDAFNGCKNLNMIRIKSKKITFVGKNAFKGIKAKAKIKVPSSKLNKYKNIFAGKGQKYTVKITK